MKNEQARFNMIEQQIRPWNVLDKGRSGIVDHRKARKILT